ncbi:MULTISPECIES: HU family DNA-binding protein [unclassified Roseovarius]|uniref:HU family DNA-binding protein n=1 Tax=unclassified Roseovarius TaxID=2614913 RepID=UPI00273DF58C|nr:MULTISPECIES: HU family DNA-binding protein [unclassified Roseovarius]
MSTRPTSSKSKSSGKTAAKKPAKTATKLANAPKSRLAGPKPPKSRVSASAAKRVSAASVAAARDTKESTSKIPAPPPPAKTGAQKPVTTMAPTPAAELKKQELIDLVVSKSDIKKKYAKPVVEAMLEVLGETLAKGREMNLQPFGKVKYNRTKETTSARVVVTKIRQSKPAKTRAASPKSKVADAAE